MVALGKISTLDNLRKRHVILMNLFCMCKKNGEFIDHPLLQCEVARDLWAFNFLSFWDRVGYAPMSGEAVG